VLAGDPSLRLKNGCAQDDATKPLPNLGLSLAFFTASGRMMRQSITGL
jgi:hypothetical protein